MTINCLYASLALASTAFLGLVSVLRARHHPSNAGGFRLTPGQMRFRVVIPAAHQFRPAVTLVTCRIFLAMDRCHRCSLGVYSGLVSHYRDACKKLASDCRERVEQQIAASSSEKDWGQIATNIQRECALPIAEFQSLLGHFGTVLVVPRSIKAAWQGACRAHQKKGAELSPTHRPAVLGRAIAIDKYAALIVDATEGGLDENSARELLFRYAGRSQVGNADDELSIRSSKVGRYLVWATFAESSPAQTPFPKASYDSADVLTALGLGGLMGTTLVLLTYRADQAGHHLPLYRPTVADAEWYPYYRPYDKPDHPWGYTEPLAPNSLGLSPQPEIVHGDEARGDRLIFPFKIATG